MLDYVLLLVGFVLLIKGADYFVSGCSSVAKILRVPSIIIGLTVVAFGTSLPEASVSITAAISGQNELSLSNVIGSNLFNLLVVVGVSAAIYPMAVKASVLKKDYPFSIIITILLLIMCIPTVFGGEKQSIITNVEGLILLAAFAIYLVSTIRDALKARKEDQPVQDEYHVIPPLVTAIYIIGGIAAIKFGGDFVVNSASSIATKFGLSQTMIGLTIVALGTSLPELVTSIVAAKKGEVDLALGNVVGSNIFNILLVLGASTALHPVKVNLFSIYDIIILIATSIIVYLFAVQKKQISRKEGILMLPMYAIFFIFVVLR